MSEAKFKLCDLVQHKASGERGIVILLWSRCTVHDRLMTTPFCGEGDDCEIEFAGFYDLSIGIERVAEQVDEGFLELVGDSVTLGEGTSGTTTEEISWCGICDKETMQTVHDSGHERDSSGDHRECHECGGYRSGMAEDWQAKEPTENPMAGRQQSEPLGGTS